MKIDMFNELQDPRPWTPGHQQTRFRQAIEQAELADALGYGCWWQVEHHGAEEFSLSSAPDLFLAALSQRTSSIRLGHSAVQVPGNNPLHVAERAATLDHLSGGRVELGLTRSTAPQWRLYGVDPTDVRSSNQEAFEAVPRMWTDDRTTYRGRHFRFDDLPVTPKPLQEPHPPLWQAASTLTSFQDAGAKGVGVLGTTLWEPVERVQRMIHAYREAARDCVDPVGAYVNNQVGFFTFVHCAETDTEAMRAGAAVAAACYSVTALTFFEARQAFLQTVRAQRENPGHIVVPAPRDPAHDNPTAAQRVIGRMLGGEEVPEEELFTVLSEEDSLIIGSPATCRRKLARFADLGVDRLLCLHQVGDLSQQRVLRSIELIGSLIPEFA